LGAADDVEGVDGVEDADMGDAQLLEQGADG
jgi:hypothetical protein